MLHRWLTLSWDREEIISKKNFSRKKPVFPVFFMPDVLLNFSFVLNWYIFCRLFKLDIVKFENKVQQG